MFGLAAIKSQFMMANSIQLKGVAISKMQIQQDQSQYPDQVKMRGNSQTRWLLMALATASLMEWT